MLYIAKIENIKYLEKGNIIYREHTHVLAVSLIDWFGLHLFNQLSYFKGMQISNINFPSGCSAALL